MTVVRHGRRAVGLFGGQAVLGPSRLGARLPVLRVFPGCVRFVVLFEIGWPDPRDHELGEAEHRQFGRQAVRLFTGRHAPSRPDTEIKRHGFTEY